MSPLELDVKTLNFSIRIFCFFVEKVQDFSDFSGRKLEVFCEFFKRKAADPRIVYVKIIRQQLQNSKENQVSVTPETLDGLEY